MCTHLSCAAAGLQYPVAFAHETGSKSENNKKDDQMMSPSKIERDERGKKRIRRRRRQELGKAQVSKERVLVGWNSSLHTKKKKKKRLECAGEKTGRGEGIKALVHHTVHLVLSSTLSLTRRPI